MNAAVTKIGSFYEHVCTNPLCKMEYCSFDIEEGLCPSCKAGKKPLRPLHAMPTKTVDPDFDGVAIQTELLPVIDTLLAKYSRATRVAAEKTKAERGYFDTLYARVTSLIEAMPINWRITTKTLRKLLEIPSDDRATIVFLRKILDRATREGLLKIVGNVTHNAAMFQKIVAPLPDAIKELQDTIDGE